MPPTRTDSGSLLERAFADAIGGTETAGADPVVLDAAYDLFCRLGVARTTMDDVARRAGVSRITLYRRVANKDALVEQVLLREFRQYVDQFLLDLKDATTVGDRVVAGFVSALRAIRSNPLGAVLLQSDPVTAGSSLFGPGGQNHAVVRRFVAGQLRLEQRAGNVAPDLEVDLVADLMVRVSASFLLTPSDLVDLDDERQLAEVARRFLVPMLTP